MLAYLFRLPVRPKHAEKDPQSTRAAANASPRLHKSRLRRWVAIIPQALESLVILVVFLPVILCMYAAYYLHQSD